MCFNRKEKEKEEIETSEELIRRLKRELSELRACKRILEEKYLGKYVKATETDRFENGVTEVATMFIQIKSIKCQGFNDVRLTGKGGRIYPSGSAGLSSDFVIYLRDSVLTEDITKEEFEEFMTSAFNKIMEGGE